MKKILLCAACLLLLTGCGAKTGASAPDKATTLSADPAGIEGETHMTLPESADAETTAPDEKVSGQALEKDGKVYGFELRFPQNQTAEKLLSDPENYYFGILECGKKRAAVPTEDIRVLTDITTHEFVVTLLLPADYKLSGKRCTVSLCVSPRKTDAQTMLYKAEKEIQIP